MTMKIVNVRLSVQRGVLVTRNQCLYVGQGETESRDTVCILLVRPSVREHPLPAQPNVPGLHSG